VKGLFHGTLAGFDDLKPYDLDHGDIYYGIGFHTVAYPIQLLLRPYLARKLDTDSKTALMFGKHPAVFLLFGISVVAFYRFARFFIRESSIAFAITASYAACPYLFGHAMMNIKDCPFMSVYLICTYLSVRLVKHRLQKPEASFRADAAALLFATAALASIRLPGLVILLQYAFTFALLDLSKSRAGESSARVLRWQHVAGFLGALLVLVIVVYPVFWINPWRGMLNGLKFMAWHPQRAFTLTWGREVEPCATPAYLSSWLAIKLPVMVLIGIVLVPFVLKRIAQHRFQRIAYFTLLFGSLYMLIAVVVLRSHLYDETRQLLFVYALLFLTGSVTLYVASRKLALVAALLSVAIFVWDQVQLHPYQYVYFNEFARFLDIDRLFETDYWGASGREHGRLLEHDAQLRVANKLMCIYSDPSDLYRPFIDPRICVVDLLSLRYLEEIPQKSYVVATYSRSRMKMPSYCYQFSAITRTLPLSNRVITMAVAYRCDQ
jgi:fumarate reductase subunit D